MIRHSMTRLIMTSEQPQSAMTLKLIQESVSFKSYKIYFKYLLWVFLQIGCCGADGPNDYVIMRQPLPSECRNTVTGNAFFNGCVDELTWYLEDKSIWAAGMAMALALIHVSSIILNLNQKLQALFNFRRLTLC